MNAPSETVHRILVVEDDPHLAAGVVENLRAEGYAVERVDNGRAALEALEANRCALVLLDVMLPELDGFTVCRTLRERGDNTPVLFLTARGDPADRVRGLEAGGDDYLPKPFHLKELLLRVRAILRRWEWYHSAAAETSVLRFGENEVDFRAFRARSWNGLTQELTEKEAMILKVLAEHPGQIVPRSGRECRKRRPLLAHQRIERILALEHRGERKSGLELGGQILQAVHGQVDAFVEERAVELLGEEGPSAHRPQRHLGLQITAGDDGHQLDRRRVRQGADERLDVPSLPQRERRGAGADAQYVPGHDSASMRKR